MAGNGLAGCVQQVAEVFPDACPVFVSALAAERAFDVQQVTDEILARINNGEEYPKRELPVQGKRKREADADGDQEDDEAREFARRVARYKTHHISSNEYKTTALDFLRHSFPEIKFCAIRELFEENDGRLLPAYLDIHLSELLEINDHRLRSTSYMDDQFHGSVINQSMEASQGDRRLAFEEAIFVRSNLDRLCRARVSVGSEDDEEDQGLEQASETNTAKKDNSIILGCECCWDEFEVDKMVHCNSDAALHWFCPECMKSTANARIGDSQFEIPCPCAHEGCTGTFSREMRARFLDDKMEKALERLEIEHNLRLANLKDLERCPVCPFAAEYPDIDDVPEFRCLNPECEQVTCRMCRNKEHMPAPCPERKRNPRQILEDAMTEAMLRHCNRCKRPFYKVEGCNKMRCPSCHNGQCYICKENVKDYDHFERGKCPLFDDAFARRDKEIAQVAAETKEKLLKENPDLAPESLEVKFAPVVADDEKADRARAARDAGHRPFRPPPVIVRGDGGGPVRGPRFNEPPPRYFPNFPFPPPVLEENNVAAGFQPHAPAPIVVGRPAAGWHPAPAQPAPIPRPQLPLAPYGFPHPAPPARLNEGPNAEARVLQENIPLGRPQLQHRVQQLEQQQFLMNQQLRQQAQVQHLQLHQQLMQQQEVQRHQARQRLAHQAMVQRQLAHQQAQQQARILAHMARNHRDVQREILRTRLQGELVNHPVLGRRPSMPPHLANQPQANPPHQAGAPTRPTNNAQPFAVAVQPLIVPVRPNNPPPRPPPLVPELQDFNNPGAFYGMPFLPDDFANMLDDLNHEGAAGAADATEPAPLDPWTAEQVEPLFAIAREPAAQGLASGVKAAAPTIPDIANENDGII